MPFFNHDIPCPSCGYNLRGLSLDRGCPECGLKVVSNTMHVDDRLKTERIEAEIAETLREQAEHSERQQRLDTFLSAWEKRGEQFDRLIERFDELFKGREKSDE